LPGVDLLVEHAAQLITVAGSPDGPRVGRALGDVGVILDGAVAAADGQIIAVGPTAAVRGLPGMSTPSRRIDASGRVVLPGFVDPHTHLVFAGSRAGEFEARLRGATYGEIAAAGGGILSTVAATRAATEESLLELGAVRLDRMLAGGTTTAEVKSGYGLSVDDELKILQVAHRLSSRHAVDLVPTVLAAHAVPEAYAADPDAYVRLVIQEILPAVADEDLAEFCDAFVDTTAFTAAQARAVLEAGAELGLRPKLHADEFGDFGGARLAAEVGAISADHLLQASADGLLAMADAGTIAVLLPGTALFLGLPYVSARRIVDLNVPVALGTDFNPGTAPSWSMPAMITLACVGMKLTPAEAIAAATINAAWAIGMQEEVGSVEPGKAADLVIMDVADYRELAASFGVPLVRQVIKRGEVVVG
jgi:imidazolonepropionase